MEEEVEKQSFKEKILFYITAFFVLLGIFSLFSFLFLVPFVIDPAFTTIFMEFDESPALCVVMDIDRRQGASNCSWTSCKEGCTKDIYQCTQILVNYKRMAAGTLNISRSYPAPEIVEMEEQLEKAREDYQREEYKKRFHRALRDDYDYNSHQFDMNEDEDYISEQNPTGLMGNDSEWYYTGAKLFPNVKGCGYPPMLNCTIFFKWFAQVGRNFSCFYSRVDPGLVITYLDMWQVYLNLVYALAIPIPSFILSIVYLTFAYFKIYNDDEEKAPLEKNAEAMDTEGDSVPDGTPVPVAPSGDLTPASDAFREDLASFGHHFKVAMADDMSRESFADGIPNSCSIQGFVSVGSVRYGVRLGAVSPPPPGAGPRYKAQCCWPSGPSGGHAAPAASTASAAIDVASRFTSRLPHLNVDAHSPNNTRDIFSFVNRLRLGEYDASTSEPNKRSPLTPRQTTTTKTTPTVRVHGPPNNHVAPSNHLSRDHQCYTSNLYQIQTKSLSPSAWKNHQQLRRPPFVRPQVYARLCEYEAATAAAAATADALHRYRPDNLDRLPRFRFGGNRGSSSKSRDRDRDRDYEKRDNEQRIKELADRLKRGPIPPPRNRHLLSKQSSTHKQHNAPQPKAPLVVSATLPSPSSSTTQVESVDMTLGTAAPECADVCVSDSTPVSPVSVHNPTHPLRSASFSQVDYNVDDKKYVRRRVSSAEQQAPFENLLSRATLTLPRNVKNLSAEVEKRSLAPDPSPDPVTVTPRNSVSDKYSGNLTSSEQSLEERNISQQQNKRDKSRRRKGMYISQWPHNYQQDNDLIPQCVKDIQLQDYESGKEQSYSQLMQTEIPKLQISETSDNWNVSSPSIPLSPDDESIQGLDWPSSATNSPGRATLSQQNSEEKDGMLHIRSQLLRADSLSEGEPEHSDRRSESVTMNQSDLSDCESRASIGNEPLSPHIPRRYSKRPLRGPYGQMLEAEMKKPEGRKNQYYNELKFLENLSGGSGTCSMVSLSSSNSIGAGDPKPKYVARNRGSSNHSLDDSQLSKTNSNLLSPSKCLLGNKQKQSADSVNSQNSPEPELRNMLIVTHQRTTSSPSKLEGFNSSEASTELLEQLLRGSSEQLAADINLQRYNDTRTHVVVELYDTETSYVESLQILVSKYLEPLKCPENANLLDASLVDEIFYQIPTILDHHQLFLEELKKRLDQWNVKQKIGDVFLDMFSKASIIDTYINYVNNWKRAREIIKTAQQNKPAFARFLEAMAREHKGKLALDSLLIKPIQKFPKYELLIQRLIKHTDSSHPDHSLLLTAQREIHEHLLKINCTEREALEQEQLREIESLIEGLMELVSADRQYLRHDLVSMSAGNGARKERALFLFSDLLLVTSIKRRSGTIRRPQTTTVLPPSGTGVASSLEANKYKLLMRIALDDLEIVRTKDENLRQMLQEIENLTDDITVMTQINEMVWSLHCSHSQLDEIVRDMLGTLNKQLTEQQNSDSQLACLDLNLNTSSGLENVSILFSKPEKMASWEECFNEAKHKLAMCGERRPSPELVAAVPIRKTRAGLQFTCAAPTAAEHGERDGRDVWVCNSDGYVGQVCILSLHPEPTVTSCNGVCNARILCLASVPGASNYRRFKGQFRKTLGGWGPSFTSDTDSPTPSHESRVTEKKKEEQQQTTRQLLDSGSSSSDDERSEEEEEEEPLKAALKNLAMSRSAETLCIDDADSDNQQSTMWLGTEDGCIHVYNSCDNIRIKKNKLRLQHTSSILSIIYLDHKVYVSLSNGDLVIYERDAQGSFNTVSPTTVALGTSAAPITKMIPHGGRLWCACGNTVKVFSTQTLQTESVLTVGGSGGGGGAGTNPDTINKPINCLVISGHGVWLSLQNTSVVKCYHTHTFDLLCEVNVAPAVTKMLISCDDIIRQHKAACLRVTALLACRDLLWVGTSAGVLLTVPLPHVGASTVRLSAMPPVAGVPHGHTGHVRFLTHLDVGSGSTDSDQQQQQSHQQPQSHHAHHHQRKDHHIGAHKTTGKHMGDARAQNKCLVISGGDGYEDFRSSGISEVAGREDSTNHLLLWHI